MGFSKNTQATRSTLMSVDSTLSEAITASQDYIPIASTTSFSTSVVAEIETTNEVVSFGSITTNLFTYSEQFDNAVWTKWNGSVSANAGVAPDGTTTADKAIASTTNHKFHGVYQNISFSDQSISIYAKADGYDFLVISLYVAASTSLGAQFNLSTGVVVNSSTGASGTIEDVGNDWYRCSLIPSVTVTSSFVLINISDGGTPSTSDYYYPPAWIPDGSGGILLWGAQREAGAAVTGYLPTTSSSLSGLTDVTRGANGTTAQSASSSDSIQQLPYALSEVNMPTRLKGLSVTSDGTGAGRLTLCDKVGTTLLDIDLPDDSGYELDFGDDRGIVFPNGIYVANSDNLTAYTLFTDKHSGTGLS